MKSDFWIIIIMHSLKGMRNLQVKRSTLAVLTGGGLFFICALVFFGYGYFTLLGERIQQEGEMQKLRREMAAMEQKLKAALPQASTEQTPPSLEVYDFKINHRPKHAGFSANFRLNNESKSDVPISGTLVMVAQNESLKTPLYRVVPQMELNKGIPQQPEKGSPFELKRQKFVEAFFDTSPDEVFRTFHIYLFSQDRKLILKKSFEIPQEEQRPAEG